jgi:hypothetical protein
MRGANEAVDVRWNGRVRACVNTDSQTASEAARAAYRWRRRLRA